ncbi:hypothetical protein C8F04DRAFT_1183584 [Mycena alexandri]|uniref:Uncharacterized protein n=1 Tax=Mycena alexandri TaxID=1745969 RepID=A0AAD6SYG5_9AGAR|nr:hypothetical protein C8F04DRAFT_1183584 [Mycena alexandri]
MSSDTQRESCSRSGVLTMRELRGMTVPGVFCMVRRRLATGVEGGEPECSEREWGALLCFNERSSCFISLISSSSLESRVSSVRVRTGSVATSVLEIEESGRARGERRRMWADDIIDVIGYINHHSPPLSDGVTPPLFLPFHHHLPPSPTSASTSKLITGDDPDRLRIALPGLPSAQSIPYHERRAPGCKISSSLPQKKSESAVLQLPDFHPNGSRRRNGAGKTNEAEKRNGLTLIRTRDFPRIQIVHIYPWIAGFNVLFETTSRLLKMQAFKFAPAKKKNTAELSSAWIAGFHVLFETTSRLLKMQDFKFAPAEKLEKCGAPASAFRMHMYKWEWVTSHND